MSIYSIPSTATPISALIGQDHVKAHLEDITLSVLAGGAMPVTGLYGDPGSGKTALAMAWGRDLETRSHGGIAVRFVNCKNHANVTDDDFKGLMAELYECLSGNGPRMLLILDEFATKETSKAGSAYAKFSAMASVIGGNKGGGATISLYGCEPMRFDPHRLGLAVCTWDTGKAAADVKTRFPQERDNTVSPYSQAEMEQILPMLFRRQMKQEDCKFTWTDPAVSLFARSLRGNARQGESVAIETAIKAKGQGFFSLTKAAALEIMRAKGARPFGLTCEDIKLLRALEYGPMTESKVCAMLGDDTRKPIRRQYLEGETFATFDHEDNVIDRGPMIHLARGGKYARHPFAEKALTLLSKGGWL